MNPKPNTDIEDLVRERAHKIWIEEGQPEGRSEAHWQRAQDELQRELAAARPHPEMTASLSEPSASPDAGVTARPDPGVTAKPSTKVKTEAPRKGGPSRKG